MKYSVNGIELQYYPENESTWGSDEVLLHHSTDLTAGTSWHDSGFTIHSLVNTGAEASRFAERCKRLVIQQWRAAGLSIPADFAIARYHEIADTTEVHLAAVQYTKLLPLDLFPMDVNYITEIVSRLCKQPLIPRNPYDGQSVFHLRVIRPGHRDNNPLHRDVWLEDYADCINLYIPIVGSDEKSSLILLPGSHLWPESRVERTKEGALIDGVKFNVPAVTQIAGEFEVERPDPRFNQFLIFSPYLIHGGAVNLNNDTTRISIEMRLWKKT